MLAIVTAGNELKDTRLVIAGGTEARLGGFNDLVLQQRSTGDFEHERVVHDLLVVRELVHYNHVRNLRTLTDNHGVRF